MPASKKPVQKDKRSKARKQKMFLEKLPQYVSISRTCRVTKVPAWSIYYWIKADAAFKEKYTAAKAMALQSLEDEAVRRAFEGSIKAVYYQGKKIGTVREFSDTLLLALLKAKAPHRYRDRATPAESQAEPITAPPRAPQSIKWGDREITI